MAHSPSIQPVALSGLAVVPPLAFRLATTASTASIFANSSNLVELSSEGQLLSAVSSFRDTLLALPTNAAESSPAALLATAQGLVDAFNRLQGGAARLQSLVAALPGNALGNLQSIGIELQTASTLGIDPGALNAAIGADPAETQALLAKATQSLIDLATTTENRPETGTIGATDQPAGASTPSSAAASAPAPAAAPTVETPVSTATGSTAADDLGVATSAALGTADAMAADRRASEARLALQSLLADPRTRAINNLFDPAYSALIAAFHVIDFVLPDPALNPKALAAEVPPPISRAAMARAIAYYNEAADEAWKRIVSHTSGQA